ncbi:DUF1471 domain-containing protein [Pantoea septica]|uniref:DUF1471 domain-containing protein n=1 Tax=Pantoea septica TaxID=472695 RepID=UPI00289B99B1|nr:DUF1471 domain-containing protein [Pantoea septica]
MKTVKYALLAIALSAVSFAGFAQSITATGSTLDDAETHIAQLAQKAGATYKITESYSGNQVHMTATLYK